MLHCKDEPKIEGAATTISDGKGKLTVVTLLPAKPVIRKVEGGKKQPLTQGVRKGKYE